MLSERLNVLLDGLLDYDCSIPLSYGRPPTPSLLHRRSRVYRDSELSILTVAQSTVSAICVSPNRKLYT